MSKMIEIEGRGEVSESTIVQALDEKFGKPEKPKTFGPKQVSYTKVGVNKKNNVFVRTVPTWYHQKEFMGGEYDVLTLEETEKLREILQEAIVFARKL